MTNPVELFIGALVKNIDIESFMRVPQVAEAAASIRRIADDFRLIKEQNTRIIEILEKREYEKTAQSPSMEIVK